MSDEARRIGRGALWGLAATVIMAPFMAIGRLISARAPLFPELIAGHFIHRTHGALVAVLSVFGHLGYGVLLWFIMQVIFLPWIGWSDFGLAHSPRGGFAFYTLLLHLVYGLALGQLGAHDEVTHHASFDELGHLRHVVV